MKIAVIVLQYLLAVLAIGHAAAFGAWQWRNSKANAMTFFTYYDDMRHFRKLARFQ